MNKKLLVLLLVIVCAFANNSKSEVGYTIDDASGILHDLLNTSQQNLVDLQNAWSVKQPILQANIDGLQNDLNNKSNECANLDAVLAARQQETRNAQDYHAWLVLRVQQNVDQLAALSAQRCAQNNNYVDGLKNDKLALKLIAFLRHQISNADSFSLAQRKSFGQKLKAFLAVYKTGSLSALIQLQQNLVDASEYNIDVDYSVSDRSAEEIGVGHVDNGKGDLQVQNFQDGQRLGWVQLQQQFLELLDNLEATIHDKMANAQQDEVEASSTAADFKTNLLHEIEVYSGQIAKWNDLIASLLVLVAQDQVNCGNCRDQEASISASLVNAQQELVNETQVFERKQNGLNEEVAVFGQVIELFDGANTNQAEDFKARADNFDGDQSFSDNATYDNRQVDSIDLIN